MVKFTELVLGEEESFYLDRMRRKRHQAVYDTVRIVSRTEALNAIKRAEEILKKVEDTL